MSRENRKKIIQEIEQKRGSKVIAYITSDRPGFQVHIGADAIPLIHEHILELGEQERLKLDLFLYSRGGQSDVPWTIVSMFREYCQRGSFSVLIPYRAHSAATVIALGADEIVMTKKAELGPIDITIGRGPYNPKDEDSKQMLPISVEDVTGYFSLLERMGCKKPDKTIKGFELLTDEVHPLALGRVNRLLEETKIVASRLLSTRANPFSKKENEEIVKRITTEFYSHEHVISRTEALKYIGLRQVQNAEDVGIADELWDLYNEYKELFCFEEPFKPEEYLINNDLEEYTWPDLKLACIESTEKCDILKQDRRVRRLKQVPPEVTINLTGLSLPPINIPQLPPQITPQQFEALIQQIVSPIIQQSLNTAVQVALQEFMRSLPQAPFEHVAFNSGWGKEE